VSWEQVGWWARDREGGGEEGSGGGRDEGRERVKKGGMLESAEWPASSKVAMMVRSFGLPASSKLAMMVRSLVVMDARMDGHGPRSPPFGSSESVVHLRVTCPSNAAGDDEVLGNALHAGDDEIHGHVEDDDRRRMRCRPSCLKGIFQMEVPDKSRAATRRELTWYQHSMMFVTLQVFLELRTDGAVRLPCLLIAKRVKDS
jgi:hypothetical protein